MVFATDIDKDEGMDFDKLSTGLHQGNSWETNSARDDRRFANEIKNQLRQASSLHTRIPDIKLCGSK